MKILCIHGIGGQEASMVEWQPKWTAAITNSLQSQTTAAMPDPTIEFLSYDELFEEPLSKLSYGDFAEALGNLLAGGFTRPRGLLDFSEGTRWYAGMVVTWVNQPALRGALRKELILKMESYKPDLVIAHSLGSLITYDTFAESPELLNGRTLLTLGSQIGNPFVAGSAFAGRLRPFEKAKHWYHLYNPNDRVFTASLNVGQFQTATNFTQVVCKFGEGVGLTNFISAYTSNIAANHSAIASNPNDCYLLHPQTVQNVWLPLAASKTTDAVPKSKSFEKGLESRKTPTKQALLVGINQYPEKAN